MIVHWWQGSQHRGRVVPFVCWLNIAFAAAAIFGWALLSLVVAEPMAWATWRGLGSGPRPELYEYPFVLLWLLPVSGTILSWVSERLALRALAQFTALFPLALIGFSVSWYYILGDTYR